MASNQSPGTSSAKCPICSRPTVPDYRPFCSRRCADVDLSRWLRSTYAIPAEDNAEASEEDASVPDARPSGDKAR
jgi:endogenous inhibitor of DNA gyrase (YacG/DUF329 family)